MTRPPRIRPEPPPPDPVDAWKDVALTVRDIVVGIVLACGLPAVIVILILLFSGCTMREEKVSCIEYAVQVHDKYQGSLGDAPDFQMLLSGCEAEAATGRGPCISRGSTRYCVNPPNPRHAPPVAPSMLEAL